MAMITDLDMALNHLNGVVSRKRRFELGEWEPNDKDRRQDGSKKWKGFFGPLKRIDNPDDISTEISVGVNLNGVETDIPSLVPTLNGDELEYLLSGSNLFNRSPIAEGIIQKAVDHAKRRLATGRSVFADEQDDVYPTPAKPTSMQNWFGGLW